MFDLLQFIFSTNPKSHIKQNNDKKRPFSNVDLGASAFVLETVDAKQTPIIHESTSIIHESTCAETPKTSRTTKRFSKNREVKRRKSAENQRKQELSYEEVSKELNEFVSCCALECWQWLTVQIILYCRVFYAALENREERQSWLHGQQKRMRSQSDGLYEKYGYSIQYMDTKDRKCCSKAWKFAYGVKHATFQRQASRDRACSHPHSKKKKPPRFSKKHFLIVWLNLIATRLGCKLPFGDGTNVTQVRLPFPNKLAVYELYRSEVQWKHAQSAVRYDEFCKAWKQCPELRHVKCTKAKHAFAKCDICEDLKRKLRKQMSEAQRKHLNNHFNNHIQETWKERQQYYKARQKAADSPQKYLSIIMDAMDQNKTNVPFFQNPPKSISGLHPLLKTKLIGCMVHGHGTYLYWCTSEIQKDSSLAVECLRRTLIKYQQQQGELPPTLYLQMDNASDQKSREFLGFLGYLIQKKVFTKIKLSYLVVGHTHEDIDQYFSVISKHFKYKISSPVLSISQFRDTLQSCFTKELCIPKCIERVQYTYDTSSLAASMDPHIARFALDEKTGHNVHSFSFFLNSSSEAVMQYKMKRYSDAVYPRPYDVGSKFEITSNSTGVVVKCSAHRDSTTKKKYWTYNIQYEDPPGTLKDDLIVQRPANHTIKLFVKEVPVSFLLNPFYHDHKEAMALQRESVDTIIEKCSLAEDDPALVQEWEEFWHQMPCNVDQIQNILPFSLPNGPPAPRAATADECYSFSKNPVIDDGERSTQVVTYAGLKSAERNARLRAINDFDLSVLSPLEKEEFVILNITPTNAPQYKLPFVLAQVIEDISPQNSVDPNLQFLVQIFHPSDLKSVAKPFRAWIGDDNRRWQQIVSRDLVKAVVTMTPRSMKLSKESLKLVQELLKESQKN